MTTAPLCPKCKRPLRELGFRYGDGKIVPRYIQQMEGVKIQGEPVGLEYACLDCEINVSQPLESPPPRP